MVTGSGGLHRGSSRDALGAVGDAPADLAVTGLLPGEPDQARGHDHLSDADLRLAGLVDVDQLDPAGRVSGGQADLVTVVPLRSTLTSPVSWLTSRGRGSVTHTNVSRAVSTGMGILRMVELLLSAPDGAPGGDKRRHADKGGRGSIEAA